MTENEIKRKIIVEALIAVILSIALFGLSEYTGNILERRWVEENIFSTKISPITRTKITFQVEVKTLGQEEAWKVNAPQYILPLNADEISNLHQVISAFKLNDSQLRKMQENGFVAINGHEIDNFLDAYLKLQSLGIPIFITADSILHAYHVIFEDTLITLEKEFFINWLKQLIKTLTEKTYDIYTYLPEDSPKLKKASEIALCYFAVASKLLGIESKLPNQIEKIVNAELTLIEEHSKTAESPIFKYEEDYTQYKPRGHYTKNEDFKRYFKAMMWLGRMFFKAKSKEHTIAAIIIVKALNEAELNLNGERVKAKDVWEKIYLTTAFFIGYSDDLTIYDYEKAISQVYGEEFKLQDLKDDAKLEKLQSTLIKMNKSKIISFPIYPIENDEIIGLRFMGQRFIPDSYIFQQLVFDKVPGRIMPKALDVAAVLGSKRAEAHLTIDVKKYPNYKVQLEKLKLEFSELTLENWTQNLYFGWLYSLKAAIQNFTDHHPTFMQTQAWLDEKLNTFLGSWAELRHDTILYAKQSYTLKTSSTEALNIGYVEPIPELYQRLRLLCDITLNGLQKLKLLKDEYKEKLLEFSNMLKQLELISIKELCGYELTSEDYQLIMNIGYKLQTIMAGIRGKTLKTTLIADVHTDTNTMRVLEVGCGYVDYIIVVVKKPSGEMYVAAGPIFTYYEFTLPINQRLTDEEWINMLRGREAPGRPEWVKSYYS